MYLYIQILPNVLDDEESACQCCCCCCCRRCCFIYELNVVLFSFVCCLPVGVMVVLLEKQNDVTCRTTFKIHLVVGHNRKHFERLLFTLR